MNMTMNWNDVQFKAKDIIQFLVYIIIGVWGLSSFKNSIETIVQRQGDQITVLQSQISELKTDGKGSSKENQMFLQSIQNQVNATSTQLMVLDQRVSFLEQQMKDRNR